MSQIEYKIAWFFLYLACGAILFGVGISAFVLYETQKYIDHDNYCMNLESQASSIHDNHFMYQSGDPNNPPIINQIFKECGLN